MQSSSSDLQKTLQVLERVHDFENRYEIRRFLIVMALCGFIAILAGWIELVSHNSLNTDPAWILFGRKPSPNEFPELFIATWLVHLSPIVLVAVYTSQSFALLDWSPILRKIGLLWLSLVALGLIAVTTIGYQKEDLIPVIWTLIIVTAFLGTYRWVPEIEGLPNIRNSILFLGLYSFAIGLFTIFAINPQNAMFYFATIIGLGMVVTATVYYIRVF